MIVMSSAEQDAKIAQTKQEVDDFKSIIENFISEMRDRDNKRDADIRELRTKHDADMKEMREEIKANTRDIHTFTIAAVVGIGAIVVSVLVFVVNFILNPPQPQIYFSPPQFHSEK